MSESKQPFWDIVTTLTEYHEFLLERSAEYGELVKNNAPFGSVMLNAARELARLHASNADLLEALTDINNCIAYSDTTGEWYLIGKVRTMPALTKVRAAISKATGAA